MADTLIAATAEENNASIVTLIGATSLWPLKLWCCLIANTETGKTIREVVHEETDLSEDGLGKLSDACKVTEIRVGPVYYVELYNDKS